MEHLPGKLAAAVFALALLVGGGKVALNTLLHSSTTSARCATDKSTHLLVCSQKAATRTVARGRGATSIFVAGRFTLSATDASVFVFQPSARDQVRISGRGLVWKSQQRKRRGATITYLFGSKLVLHGDCPVRCELSVVSATSLGRGPLPAASYRGSFSGYVDLMPKDAPRRPGLHGPSVSWVKSDAGASYMLDPITPASPEYPNEFVAGEQPAETYGKGAGSIRVHFDTGISASLLSALLVQRTAFDPGFAGQVPVIGK